MIGKTEFMDYVLWLVFVLIVIFIIGKVIWPIISIG